MFHLEYALDNFKNYDTDLGKYSKRILLKCCNYSSLSEEDKLLLSLYNIKNQSDINSLFTYLKLKPITEKDKALSYFKIFGFNLKNKTAVYYLNILKT